MKKIIILGGYGNFGKRIVENLLDIQNILIYIAGRSSIKANDLINLIANNKSQLKPLVINIFSKDFETELKKISPYLVIHTGGPFQGQSHKVPEICCNIGAHYIDLADDREFVCNITKLNDSAIKNNVLLVSGASSVPGLSSSVIDHYQSHFSQIDSIDIAIVPGNKAERGEATVRGILFYTGHKFSVFKNSRWQDVYGWLDPRRIEFSDIVGKRWLANVNVPDLEIFPKRYNVKKSVIFQAGLELSFLHLSMVLMAFFVKMGTIKNWAPLTKPIIKFSNLLKRFGTDNGGMNITITGLNEHKKKKTIQWYLYAPKGVGPYIPTLSAIIIARKLLLENHETKGAKPCVDEILLEDFLPYFSELGIYLKEKIIE